MCAANIIRMDTIYRHIKRMKKEAEDYLKAGNFDSAIDIYRNLGETNKAAKLSACLENTEGDKEAACNKYLHTKFIKNQLVEFPLILGTGALLSALLFSYEIPSYTARNDLSLRKVLAAKYVEQQILPEDEIPMAGVGAIYGGFIGLWAATLNLIDKNKKHRISGQTS